MAIREATPDDVEEVQAVARASLRASYGHALEDGLIDESVDRWYDTDSLTADLESDAPAFFVAVEDGRVVGFVQSYVVERRESVGEIDWLLVDPDYRGQGIGTRLLSRVEQALLTEGVGRIEGRVLAANETGAEFYDSHGFDLTGEVTVEIGGQEFAERIYTAYPDGATGGRVLVEQRPSPDGQPIYVDYDEAVRASQGPFLATYMDRDREERYGWYCTNCDGFDAAMDAMGRVECGNCDNRSKATRWDSAYL